ncbi:MAG: Rid family hydrolase [Halopseudomonas aestusnigri]
MTPLITKITSKKAAAPLGHYAQAVLCHDILYLSLQLGITPENSSLPPGDVSHQTNQALDNVSEILLAGNSRLSQLIKVNIYLSDIKHWEVVDKIYRQRLGDHTPARSVIPCSKLHLGYDVGFEAIAQTGQAEEFKS